MPYLPDRYPVQKNQPRNIRTMSCGGRYGGTLTPCAGIIRVRFKGSQADLPASQPEAFQRPCVRLSYGGDIVSVSTPLVKIRPEKNGKNLCTFPRYYGKVLDKVGIRGFPSLEKEDFVCWISC